MTSFIKELYHSDVCGASQYHEPSDESRNAGNRQEVIGNTLSKRLDKDDYDLFNEYMHLENIIRSGENFHIYCCGMKDLLRLFISVFDEQ